MRVIEVTKKTKTDGVAKNLTAGLSSMERQILRLMAGARVYTTFHGSPSGWVQTGKGVKSVPYKVVMELERKHFIRFSHLKHGIPVYRITEKGLAADEAAFPLVELHT